jgi:hypothetical protein
MALAVSLILIKEAHICPRLGCVMKIIDKFARGRYFY